MEGYRGESGSGWRDMWEKEELGAELKECVQA
jgi:hypothetical protein